MTDRRGRRRLALRETILAAARSIVRTEGLASLTMRRIADEIDYAPASLYTHFASREALLAALCLDGFRELRSALEAAVKSVRGPRQRLIALGNAYVEFARAHAATYRLIFMEDPTLTSGVVESIDFDDGPRALELIVSPFAELKATGSIRRSADPVRLADTFWMTVHGLASLRLACPTMPTTEDKILIKTAVAALVDGCKPGPINEL